MKYRDILYDKKDGVAWITINRPEVRNAFRTRTVAELTDAFLDARFDPAVGVVVLTGAGDKPSARAGIRRSEVAADTRRTASGRWTSRRCIARSASITRRRRPWRAADLY